jgi:ankyrin repeat protein
MLLAMDGIDLNPVDEIYGLTPLLWAAINGQKGVVKSLLAKDGVNPDVRDNQGQTPRYWWQAAS